MKNRMQDVRNHLVAVMEALNDRESSPETIERAKAMAQVAQAYTAAVKVELDARKLAGVDELPEALLSAPRLVGGKAA